MSRNNHQKKTTVVIISSLAIAYAILAGIPKVFILFNQEAYNMTKELTLAASKDGLATIPFSFQLIHSLVGILVLLIAGIFMIKRKKWALYLFLLWIFGVTLLTLLISGFSFSFYAKMSVAILVIILLLKPNTRKYFIDSKRK